MKQLLYQDKEWLINRYVVQSLSLKAIGSLCKVNPSTIRNAILRHGIPLRKPGWKSGPLNGHWKGGQYISTQGYRFVMAKGHPRAINGGYIPEQIFVVEKHLNRLLTKDEIVHHIDHDRLNNSLENLYLFPSKIDHDTYHNRLRRKSIEPIFKSNLL